MGVMSGTSADGVDVALCRISPARAKGGTPSVKLIGMLGLLIRRLSGRRCLAAMDAEAISVAEMARLNWRLGEVYADAVEQTQRNLE